MGLQRGKCHVSWRDLHRFYFWLYDKGDSLFSFSICWTLISVEIPAWGNEPFWWRITGFMRNICEDSQWQVIINQGVVQMWQLDFSILENVSPLSKRLLLLQFWLTDVESQDLTLMCTRLIVCTRLTSDATEARFKGFSNVLGRDDGTASYGGDRLMVKWLRVCAGVRRLAGHLITSSCSLHVKVSLGSDTELQTAPDSVSSVWDYVWLKLLVKQVGSVR